MSGLACYGDMRGWLAPTLLMGAVAATTLATPAMAEVATDTFCFGGGTEGAIFVTPPVGRRAYVAHRDQATFLESNDVPGLQRTKYECVESTYETSTNQILSQRRYTVVPADEPAAKGLGLGCVPLVGICAA